MSDYEDLKKWTFRDFEKYEITPDAMDEFDRSLAAASARFRDALRTFGNAIKSEMKLLIDNINKTRGM